MSEDLIERLRTLPATLVTDALGKLGHNPLKFAMTGIKPLFKVNGTIAGPAVTTKYEIARERGSVQDYRDFVFKPIDEANPGDIWVISSGIERVLSMMGDIIAMGCKKRGMQGVVIDGGCRDSVALEKIGLPVFSKGTCLYGPGLFIRPVACNVPVVCGEVEVRPGDIVVADMDGILVFAPELLADVVQIAVEKNEREDEGRRLVEQGEPLSTSYPM